MISNHYLIKGGIVDAQETFNNHLNPIYHGRYYSYGMF